MYVLDLTVTGATLVTVKDDGLGKDSISVQGSYSAPVEISLCTAMLAGKTIAAGGCYYDAGGNAHRLIIHGLVENATGSNGRDLIQGSEFANRLSGEANLAGPGAADTIRGGWGNDTIHGGFGADQIFGDGTRSDLWRPWQ